MNHQLKLEKLMLAAGGIAGRAQSEVYVEMPEEN